VDLSVLDLFGAAAGGFLGAAWGGLIAFVFTGLAILTGVAALIGSHNPAVLNNFAFGAFFGPHISFAGGVGAVAYAARRGWITSGRDIVTPLVSLAKPSVLLVGAAFGIFGQVVQRLIVQIPGLGSHTDSVALTVVISALVARLLFGRTGIIGPHVDGLTGWKRFTPNAQHVWLAYQQSPFMATLLGLFTGGLSAFSAVTLLNAYPNAKGVVYLGFGVSAISLMFLALGLEVPATHHMTLVGAVAAVAFLGKVAGGDVTAVIIGAIAGALTGLVAELFSRFWLIRGDTHIDPPASAIFPMTTVVLLLAAAI
jgi:hypothetical protein